MANTMAAGPVALDASPFHPEASERLVVVSLAPGVKGQGDVIGLRSDHAKVVFKTPPAVPTQADAPSGARIQLGDVYVACVEHRTFKREGPIHSQVECQYPLGPDGPEQLRVTARSYEEAARMLAFMKKAAEVILAEKAAAKQALIDAENARLAEAEVEKIESFKRVYELHDVTVAKDRADDLIDGVRLCFFGRRVEGKSDKFIVPNKTDLDALQWYVGPFVNIVRPVSLAYAAVPRPEMQEHLLFLMEAES